MQLHLSLGVGVAFLDPRLVSLLSIGIQLEVRVLTKVPFLVDFGIVELLLLEQNVKDHRHLGAVVDNEDEACPFDRVRLDLEMGVLKHRNPPAGNLLSLLLGVNFWVERHKDHRSLPFLGSPCCLVGAPQGPAFHRIRHRRRVHPAGGPRRRWACHSTRIVPRFRGGNSSSRALSHRGAAVQADPSERGWSGGAWEGRGPRLKVRRTPLAAAEASFPARDHLRPVLRLRPIRPQSSLHHCPTFC
mmetsp:Transcript_31210/g.93648  ORF Transcript_31210/g.93648 Transcript_31210/m.93648 type:complete len:244 (-) Transcript_31210:96-827(-)